LNERNSINGQEIWGEEYDTLQKMRQKDIPYKKAQVQLMRIWKERQIKELQLAEEIIIIFLKNLVLIYITRRCRSGQTGQKKCPSLGQSGGRYYELTL